MFPSRPHPKLIQASMYWLCTTFSYTHTLWCCSNTFFSRGNCRIDSWNEREVELNNKYMKWKDTLHVIRLNQQIAAAITRFLLRIDRTYFEKDQEIVGHCQKFLLGEFVRSSVQAAAQQQLLKHRIRSLKLGYATHLALFSPIHTHMMDRTLSIVIFIRFFLKKGFCSLIFFSMIGVMI